MYVCLLIENSFVLKGVCAFIGQNPFHNGRNYYRMKKNYIMKIRIIMGPINKSLADIQLTYFNTGVEKGYTYI